MISLDRGQNNVDGNTGNNDNCTIIYDNCMICGCLREEFKPSLSDSLTRWFRTPTFPEMERVRPREIYQNKLGIATAGI